jgi:conserved oligomeric Golgi complex subunit 6
MDAMENLKDLQSSKLAREITEEAADKFCDDFEQVEEKLIAADELLEEVDDGSALEPLRALFPRTGAEIRVLLS